MKKNFIYKYVPFSTNSLKILINNELWFGLPQNLNDPYEGEFQVGKYYKLPEIGMIEFFYKSTSNIFEIKNLKSKIEEVKNDINVFHDDLHKYLKYRIENYYGLTSFSYDPLNILMWSYYADSHKGFCIGFDKNELIETLKHPNKEFFDVDYKKNICQAILNIEEDKLGFKNEKELLYSKLDIWKNEKELRLITFLYTRNKRNIGFDNSCIKEIIFGERTSVEDCTTIKNIIKHNSRTSHTKFCKAYKTIDKKRMKIKKYIW